jgi:Zn-dependent peptidase ImmA (M78 family)
MIQRRTHLTPAEQIIYNLGIADPGEIDLDAIAWTQGARVRYRPLRGCEARIFGRSDEAIISVNSNTSATRRRFSLAHELGHWHHHRGQLLFCRASDIGPGGARPQTELVADRFAADLLMPSFLFVPRLSGLRRFGLSELETLAAEFRVSRAAAAIRAIERGQLPALVVCHNRAGRKWFARSPIVPEKWFPSKELSAETGAFAVQFGQKKEDRQGRKVRASAWFELRGADRFDVHEETIRSAEDETLTLLWLGDARMLEA